MHVFHIRYRNTQGTLMRILNAASRRGIDIPYVQAEPAEHTHRVTLLLNVNAKQMGQLCRDWHAIVDVMDLHAGAPLKEMMHATGDWQTPYAPASVRPAEGARPAMA
jgi:acetolactate synthase small subunit